MEFQYHTLSNGIRLVHKQIANGVAHCGLIINAGTRDEKEDENGIAHFIEHVIFKGTKHRRAYHILSRMENVGGDLNAYTTKEETVVYSSFLPRYYDRAFELISDIVFNSVFPAKEILKEKDVVQDEINHYKDTPSEEIFDEFENLLYQGHPMGRNILGTPEDVKKINKSRILQFIRNHYHTDQMVLSSVGNIEFRKLIGLAEKYFGEEKPSLRTESRKPYKKYRPKNRTEEKDTYLSHGCIGNIAYPRNDERRLILVLLNNILGGPGLNSRLNLGIREKYGFTYSIDSQYAPYSDTGVFSIYLGTDKGYMDKSIGLIHKELTRLRDNKLGTLQMSRAKQQIVGQLAISLESNLSSMLSNGKSYLHLGKVFTFNEIASNIDLISAEELLSVANEIFNPSQLTTLIYKSNPQKK